MSAPQATDRHQARIAVITAALVVAVRRSWRRLNPSQPLERQYAETVGPQIALTVVAAQVAASRTSDNYIAEVLNELDFGPVTQSGAIRPNAFAGFAGNGIPVDEVLGPSVGRVRALQSQQGMSVEAALLETEDLIDGILETILADTARAAEQAAMAQRPWVDGWVRVAEPGACSRCIVLTGKFFLFNEGFERHPRCRCDHVPAPSDGEALKWLLSAETPEGRFEALTPEEQDATFGEAGAQAIREGADISQVVNARRGMRKAQVYGRDVLVTTEGITRRGLSSGRRKRGAVRLMPEAIFEIADGDRAEILRLLRLHGYIN
tara:strand:+ start:3424 stop:4386 length:963 start_codon:yes stop_codon:yes gene_type:complete